MKKLTSVLLSLVMLMSVLCTGALAAGQNDYLEPAVTVHEGAKTISLNISALQPTTNGKIGVKFDPNCLAYTGSEIDGIITDTAVENGYLTVIYATSNAEPMTVGMPIVTLNFAVLNNQAKTDINVAILEFNAFENLDIVLPTITVCLSDSSSLPVGPSVPPSQPTPPAPPADDDEDKPGIDITVPELTDAKYQAILAQYPDAKGHWAEKEIVKAINAGLFNGTGANTFSPNGDVTRGMFATLLYRLSGSPAVGTRMPFGDVSSSQYYYDAIIWAYSNGIVTGLTDTQFAPDAKVSREQMVTMLYRYAKYINDDTSASTSLAGFGDNAAVSGWAKEAMSWAVAEGLINGSNGNLNPAANSTRAQIATVLVRYVGL